MQLLLLVVIVVVITGCGDDDDGDEVNCIEEPGDSGNAKIEVQGTLTVVGTMEGTPWKDECSLTNPAILHEWTCKDDKPFLENYDCEEAKNYATCREGRCVKNNDCVGDCSSDINFECQYFGEPCGNFCPETIPFTCEDEYTREPGSSVPYRLIEYNLRDHLCTSALECDPLPEGCKRYVESDYCADFIVDDDGDGVPNNLDNCLMDIFEKSLMDYDEFGCPPEVSIPDVCQTEHQGSESNLNIVITPCGFDSNQNNIFSYWSKLIASEMQEVEPFKSLKEKYSLSYVWNLAKSDIKGYDVDEQGVKTENDKRCFDSVQATREMVESAGCSQENIVYLEIQHNSLYMDTESGENIFRDGTSKPWEKYGYISQGIPWQCPGVDYIDCINRNDKLVGVALHELGHLFKIGHPFGFAEDEISDNGKYILGGYNDYYTPHLLARNDIGISKVNYYAKEPCPIWNSGDYLYWASINDQTMGCYWGYKVEEGYNKYTYSSLKTLDENSGNSLMTYNYNSPYKYDPVSTKLIADALNYGYDEYIKWEYPYDCNSIKFSTYLKDSPRELDSEELSKLFLECKINECKYIDKELIIGESQIVENIGKKARDVCCESVIDPDVHTECINTDVPVI